MHVSIMWLLRVIGFLVLLSIFGVPWLGRVVITLYAIVILDVHAEEYS